MSKSVLKIRCKELKTKLRTLETEFNQLKEVINSRYNETVNTIIEGLDFIDLYNQSVIKFSQANFQDSLCTILIIETFCELDSNVTADVDRYYVNVVDTCDIKSEFDNVKNWHPYAKIKSIIGSRFNKNRTWIYVVDGFSICGDTEIEQKQKYLNIGEMNMDEFIDDFTEYINQKD